MAPANWTRGCGCGWPSRRSATPTGHTRAQLRAWLTRRVAAIDPAAVQRRRKKAVRARRVWITPDTDGMATLGAYLSAEEAQACWNALAAGAANIEGGIDPARADLLVARLTGLELGQPGPGAGAAHPRRPGTGRTRPAEPPPHRRPVPARPADRPHRARARRAATGPHPGWPAGCVPVTGTAASPAAAARRCMCDLDHVIPHPAGPTSESNLAALCRYHHRLKTHTGWTVRMHARRHPGMDQPPRPHLPHQPRTTPNTNHRRESGTRNHTCTNGSSLRGDGLLHATDPLGQSRVPACRGRVIDPTRAMGRSCAHHSCQRGMMGSGIAGGSG